MYYFGLPFLLEAAGLVVFVCWYYVKYGRKYNKCAKKFPGPPGVPIIGNVIELRSPEVILDVFEKYKNKYGPIFHLWAGIIGPIEFVLVITDTKFLELVLGTQKILNKPFTYKFLHRWLGTGLLTSTGKKWKQRRRIITPTFHFEILENYIDVFNTESDILIKKLKNEVGRASVDIYPFVTLCFLDIICQTAMGVSVNAQFQPDSKYVYSVNEMCRIIMERTVTVTKFYDLTYLLSKDYFKERKALKVLHDYTDSVIVNRKRESQAKKTDENNKCPKKRCTFLDLLLQCNVDGKPLTPEDIREEVDTFMFEGHDTTSSAISFALYSLANNPEVQEKAVEELIRIFGEDKESQPTQKDLQEMKYLEMVIKETLRLYPSVPLFGRYLDEEISYGDISLPEGVTLVINAFGIHRDPKIYPDPEKFDPERFTQENCAGRPPYAYIPFSAGPRNCIGQKFALLEMKSTISKILRNFELHPATPKHKLNLSSESILKSKNGVRISLRKRNYSNLN